MGAGMSAFTPGPWVHYDDSEDGKTGRHEIAALGKTVARIYCSVPDQDFANARLIAASPDLLAALQAFVDEVEGTFPFGSLTAARAAIAKATQPEPEYIPGSHDLAESAGMVEP